MWFFKYRSSILFFLEVKYQFAIILPLKNNQSELRYFKNYLTVFLDMSISLTHKNLTGVTPIAFDEFFDKVEPLLCPNNE